MGSVLRLTDLHDDHFRCKWPKLDENPDTTEQMVLGETRQAEFGHHTT